MVAGTSKARTTVASMTIAIDHADADQLDERDAGGENAPITTTSSSGGGW